MSCYHGTVDIGFWTFNGHLQNSHTYHSPLFKRSKDPTPTLHSLKQTVGCANSPPAIHAWIASFKQPQDIITRFIN